MDFPVPPDAVGSEQQGPRPAVVISLDSFNRAMKVVVVAAITTKVKPSRTTLLLPVGRPLSRESMVLPFQIHTFARERLRSRAGCLDSGQIADLEDKLRLSWGL